MDDMREVNTPRPDWDHVEKLIDAEKWKDLSVNKSSTEMLDVLIHDMSVSNKREFLGMGTGPEVPIYLRLDGRAKNRNLPRRDISNIVAEIIKERVQQKENVYNLIPDTELHILICVLYLKIVLNNNLSRLTRD
jgi:hypothetical protein